MKYLIPTLGLSAIVMLSFTISQPKNKFVEPPINISVLNHTQKQNGNGEQLINKSDCIGCHKKDSKLIGPSYLDIAKKYPKTEKNIKLLADKIIKGGTGVWGQIPMTPHPKVTDTEAKYMVKYILSLKK